MYDVATREYHVTPGDSFGSAGEDLSGLSYALFAEQLLEGMKYIRAFVKSL